MTNGVFPAPPVERFPTLITGSVSIRLRSHPWLYAEFLIARPAAYRGCNGASALRFTAHAPPATVRAHHSFAATRPCVPEPQRARAHLLHARPHHPRAA